MDIAVDPTLRFLGAHADVLVLLTRLSLFSQTAPLLTPEQQRENALGLIRPLESALIEHLKDEEATLFVQMVELARSDEEKQTVLALVERLTLEHRQIEASWATLRTVLTRLSDGHAELPPPALCADLLKLYQQHASYEENHVLPLGQRILSDDGKRARAAAGDLRHLVSEIPRLI